MPVRFFFAGLLSAPVAVTSPGIPADAQESATKPRSQSGTNYQVNGKQYVSVVATNMVVTLALP